jgi:hypothetical protein
METGQQLQYFAPDSITTPGPDRIKGQWNTPVQLRGGEQSEADVALMIPMARATCSIVYFICNIATSMYLNQQTVNCQNNIELILHIKFLAQLFESNFASSLFTKFH